MGADNYFNPPAPDKFVLLIRELRGQSHGAEANAAIYKFQEENRRGRDGSEDWELMQAIGGSERVESARKVAMATQLQWVYVPVTAVFSPTVAPEVMREWLHPTPPKPPKPVTITRASAYQLLHPAGNGQDNKAALEELQLAFDESDE